MSRPLPLVVTLGRLTYEAREKLAAEKLAPEVVRDAASRAARDGLNAVTIPLGPAPLEKTKAAKALQAALPGFAFEWVDGLTREGQPNFEMKMLWSALSDEAPAPATS